MLRGRWPRPEHRQTRPQQSRSRVDARDKRAADLQGEAELDLRVDVVYRPDSETLQGEGQDQLHLEQREVVADALSRPPSSRRSSSDTAMSTEG